MLTAYGPMTMALLVAYYIFDVPIRGSLVLLYGLSLLLMGGTLGIGTLVSAASRTVPQAMPLAFLTFLPSIYLSGLLFPIEGMPRGAQYLAVAQSASARGVRRGGLHAGCRALPEAVRLSP